MAEDFDDWLNRFAEDHAERLGTIEQAKEQREDQQIILMMEFGDLAREVISPVFERVAEKIDGVAMSDEDRDRITLSFKGPKQLRKLSFAVNAEESCVQLQFRTWPLSGSTRDVGAAYRAGWQVLNSWQVVKEIDEGTVKQAVREFIERG